MQFRWCNQTPGLPKVRFELFVADAIDLDSYPPPNADVRRPVKLFRRLLNQRLLHSDCGWDGHRDVTIAMMIIREHSEDFFANKPGGLAVRNLLPGFGK